MTEMAEGQNLPPVGRWGLTQPIHCLLVTELGTCERCLFDTFQLLAKCWCWISAKGIWVPKGVSALILRRRPQDDKHFSRSDYALEMSSLSQWKESVLRVFTMFDSCGDLVVRAISHKSSPPVREVKLGGGGAARGIENVVWSRKRMRLSIIRMDFTRL